MQSAASASALALAGGLGIGDWGLGGLVDGDESDPITNHPNPQSLIPNPRQRQYRAVSRIAFRTSADCGRMASSRSGQYDTGVASAPTRRTGASRCSNSSPAIRAPSSAPKLHIV